MSDKKFNIFQVAGIYKAEEIHTRVIAELINPKSPFHNNGTAFLGKFLQKLDDITLSDKELANAEVKTEVRTDEGRRIDLVISTKSRYLPFEVKIRAEDQDVQLQDYYKFAEAQAKDGQEVPCIYYLTPNKKEPSKQSRGNLTRDQIRLLSFEEDILRWLEKCIKELENPSDVLEITKQLRDNIKSQPGKAVFSEWTWGDVLDIICTELSRNYNLHWIECTYRYKIFTLNRKEFGKESLELALWVEKESKDKLGLYLICALTREDGIPSYRHDIPYSDGRYDELLKATFLDDGRALGLQTKRMWDRLPNDSRYKSLDAETCYSKIEEIFEQLQPDPYRRLKRNEAEGKRQHKSGKGEREA